MAVSYWGIWEESVIDWNYFRHGSTNNFNKKNTSETNKDNLFVSLALNGLGLDVSLNTHPRWKLVFLLIINNLRSN